MVEEIDFNKWLGLLKSRKFWILVIAIVSTVGAYAVGEIDVWQGLQAVIAALAAFSTGIAIEDAGRNVGLYK